MKVHDPATCTECGPPCDRCGRRPASHVATHRFVRHDGQPTETQTLCAAHADELAFTLADYWKIQPIAGCGARNP